MHPSCATSRENNFNLLRFILAALVILAHSSEIIDGNRSREILTVVFKTSLSFGDLAVDGFFLLSGYLIVQSWDQAPHVLRFMKSRALRIYPGFIVASLVSALVFGPMAADTLQYFGAFWVGGYFQSLLLLQPPTVPAVFEGTPYPSINGAMWTIAHEFKCYVLVCLMGSLGLLRRRRVWLAMAVAVMSLLMFQRFGNVLRIGDHVLSFTNPMIRLTAFFLVGGCFYLYRDRIRYNTPLLVISSLSLALGLFWKNGHELVLAIAGGYLLFHAAFARIPAIAGFRRLPDVSFGVYLYAWPVQKLLVWNFPGISPLAVTIFTLGISVAFGALSWYLVEKPCLRFKSRSKIAGPDAVVATVPMAAN